MTIEHPPATHWHSLLGDSGGELCRALAARMRERHLTFGGRLLCPFLRPFFLDAVGEARIRAAAETMARLGERIVRAALESPALFEQLGLSDEEERLARIEPGYATATTASRVDAFLLPESLQFVEYNAESPAGVGYSTRLCEVFDELPVMARFRERYTTRFYPAIDALLQALLASYGEWGGTETGPQVAIVDWREVPTWSEFELLRDAFAERGVSTLICDPREMTFDRGGLWASGVRIDLVYRRVLMNDIVARPDECKALVDAYSARVVCVANSFRCKLPHKKAFFAVITDARNAPLFSDDERVMIRQHVPWTRVIREGRTEHHGKPIDLLPWIRMHRAGLAVKPSDEYGGSGVTLGWECDERQWDQVIDRARGDATSVWIVQERVGVQREPFPRCGEDGALHSQDMLVDVAPYLFRGRLGGFLTRLSTSGLANITSGGGQVPAFVVDDRHTP
ncbi:MAG: hypothetical protein GEU99_24375 [Luteitalea sp.]|nr:hypothetical protein [Luteitalea sp.]